MKYLNLIFGIYMTASAVANFYAGNYGWFIIDGFLAALNLRGYFQYVEMEKTRA